MSTARAQTSLGRSEVVRTTAPHPYVNAAPRRPRRSVGQRQAALRFGDAAERDTAAFLRAGGYEVLGRRVKVGHAEVDIIARRDDVVAFVEVKARSRGWDGLEAVTSSKQKRLVRAASRWLSENPNQHGNSIRLDIALAWPGGAIEYLESAFEADAAQHEVFI